MSQPLYRELAERLRADIASGHYPLGSQLPPELELCETYKVSRHTARDALRLLREAGLVERRRGVGTTVTNVGETPHFVQPLGGIDELMQYARDARLAIRSVGVRPLTPSERAWLELDTDDAWLVGAGVRRGDSKPLAISTIYLPPAFTEIAPELKDWQGAVQELLLQRFGASVNRIEQEMSAVILETEQARVLKSERGGAALRTLRRYYDQTDSLMLASDSVHPASRFVYSMSYRRDV